MRFVTVRRVFCQISIYIRLVPVPSVMVDVVMMKQKIKRGKTRRLREWMAEIRRREDEAVETYESEGMYSESAFIEQTDDGDFLVYYMESEDTGRGRTRPSKTRRTR
jgi:Tfp pilus assembly protein PilP